MCIETRKYGSWKRRTKVNQVKSGKENVSGTKQIHAELGNKRGFALRDENDDVADEVQIRKKLKTKAERWHLTEIQVEVANQKWPQLDQ